MKRVLVLEPVKQDLKPAERHGEVEYMFRRHHECPSPHQIGFDHSIISRLEELYYDPSRDLVVIVGGLTIMTAFVAVVTANWGYMRTLVWNPKEGQRGYEESWYGLRSRLSKSLVN